MPFSTSRTSPIMVERDTELAELDALASHAAGGRCQMALLTGEAGIGKSSVAREITRRCQARGFDTLPAGYSGPLYLEISPRTFPVRVRRGSRLSQMRFRVGDTRLGIAELIHGCLVRAQPVGGDRHR